MFITPSASSSRVDPDASRELAWNITGPANRVLSARTLVTRCIPHMHDRHSVALLYAGIGRVWMRGTVHTWKTGSLLFCSPFELHSGHNETTEFEYDVCYLSPNLVAEALGSKTHLPSFKQPVVSDSSAVAAWTKVFASQPRTREEGTTGIFERHVIDALRHHAHLTVPGPEALHACISPNIRAVMDWLRSSAVNDVRLCRVTEISGLSRSHALEMFRRATGMSPGKYMRDLRLNMALDLICSGKSLSEVAHTLQFADQAHFSREFKRLFGTSPGQLARSVRL